MPGARLWLTLIVPLLGASLFAQREPQPAPNRQQLAGTWKLDGICPPEIERSWNRTPTQPSGGTTARQERETLLSLRCFGQKLIAGSEALAISVATDAITIDDDFREPTRYATSEATTIRVVTGPMDKRIMPSCVFSSMDVRVKTSWNGAALVQELWTRDLLEIVRITRTFITYDEGRKMLLVIKVLEPKLKDPVRDIERVYLRSSVPGPGSSVLWR